MFVISSAAPSGGAISCPRRTLEEALKLAVHRMEQGYSNVTIRDPTTGRVWGEPRIRAIVTSEGMSRALGAHQSSSEPGEASSSTGENNQSVEPARERVGAGIRGRRSAWSFLAWIGARFVTARGMERPG
jgi:hypothetical protein